MCENLKQYGSHDGIKYAKTCLGIETLPHAQALAVLRETHARMHAELLTVCEVHEVSQAELEVYLNEYASTK